MTQTNLNKFIEGTEAVFREIGFNDVHTNNDPFSEEGQLIVITVGITGEYNGTFILKASEPSATSFIDKMLENLGMNDAEEGFGTFHKEAMGEVLNQISGRSVMLLADDGIDCNITPPTIFTGGNLSVNLRDSRSEITKTLHGAFGTFELYVGIK